MYTIQFKFEQKGLEPVTLEGIEGGQSLLEIALDNGIELHHNCGMVCACSTCHLYLEQGEDSVPEITDREEDFIDRARNPRLNSRLGCQCVLEDGGEGTIVATLPDQSTIHGD
jgi:2Fe-2S ferredoxin